MEQSAKDIWKRLLEQARARLPEPTLRTWLEPAEPVSFEAGRLVVATPDQFAAEWNESKHARLLAELAGQVVGRPTEVVFRVQEERAKRPQMDFFVAAPAQPGATTVLTQEAVRWLASWLRSHFDLVLVDGPSVDAATELAVLLPACEGLYLVLPRGESNQTQRQSAQALATLGGRLRGVVHTQFEG